MTIHKMWFEFWHHLPSLYFDIANILRKADKFQSVWINFTFLKSAHVECTKISLRLNLMWKFVGNWHCNIHRARKIFKVMFFSFDQRMNLINIGPNMWICQILTFVVLEKYFILGKNGRNFHSIWEEAMRGNWEHLTLLSLHYFARPEQRARRLLPFASKELKTRIWRTADKLLNTKF